MFPDIRIIHATGEEDYHYGIDFHIMKKGFRVCALQVKPESYKSDKSYVRIARKANQIKNEAFTKDRGAPVYVILITKAGQIVENQSFKIFSERVSQFDL